MKKGESPNRKPSSVEAGGERKTSTSEECANWGIFVSSLVETITVLVSSGSICKQSIKSGCFGYAKEQRIYHAQIETSIIHYSTI